MFMGGTSYFSFAVVRYKSQNSKDLITSTNLVHTQKSGVKSNKFNDALFFFKPVTKMVK